jgi:hypothetical protein
MLAAVVRALDEWERSATRVVFGVGVWGLECVGFVVRCCCGSVHGLGVGRAVVRCGSALRVWSVLCGTGGGREVTLCSPGKFSRPRVVFTTATLQRRSRACLRRTTTPRPRLIAPRSTSAPRFTRAADGQGTGCIVAALRVCAAMVMPAVCGCRWDVGHGLRVAGCGLRRRTREAGARRMAPLRQLFLLDVVVYFMYWIDMVGSWKIGTRKSTST